MTSELSNSSASGLPSTEGGAPGWVEHSLVLRVPGWTIPAALTLPAPAQPGARVASAILLVPGSLFCDVNGDFPIWQSFPHVYAHLARQLAEVGHAVYRFAKLGPGTGSVAVDDSAAALRTWDGRLTIATAALDAMRHELQTRGIRAEHVIAAGHSEGSVVVSRLALDDAGRALDGVALLAGPSVGILEIMREQLAQSVPPESVDDERRWLDEAIACIRRREAVPQTLRTASPFGASALASMPEEAQRYMGDVDATDPVALARAITQPTLIVQGGSDDSVPAHHGEALRDARGAGGSYLFVPELSHMFKVVPNGTTRGEAFGYPGPVDARVPSAIDAWVRSLPPVRP